MTQGTDTDLPDDLAEQVHWLSAQYNNTANPVFSRTREEFAALFNGLKLIEPGVVWAAQWRPDDPLGNDSMRLNLMAGVGHKP